MMSKGIDDMMKIALKLLCKQHPGGAHSHMLQDNAEDEDEAQNSGR
jgi:hypothetical protein